MKFNNYKKDEQEKMQVEILVVFFFQFEIKKEKSRLGLLFLLKIDERTNEAPDCQTLNKNMRKIERAILILKEIRRKEFEKTNIGNKPDVASRSLLNNIKKKKKRNNKKRRMKKNSI